MITEDRKKIGERLFEFAIKLNGNKKAGAKQHLANKLKIEAGTLSPYFKGEHIPGNLMQIKLRELGADTHYIITGNRITEIREAGIEYLDNNDSERIFSIVHQLEIRRDLARLINNSIEVLIQELKTKKNIERHPSLLRRLITNYNIHNQEFESLDETEINYTVNELDTLVKNLMN